MASQSNAPGYTASKPLVLLLSLNHASYFDEMYSGLLTPLLAGARIKRAKKYESALKLLDSSQSETPAVVLVTDPGIAKHDDLIAQLKQYAISGGSLIVACHFSSNITPDSMNKFWPKLDVNWKFGDYHRTTTHLNQRAAKNIKPQSKIYLPAAVGMKSVHLRGVTPNAALYLPNRESTVESSVFPPDSVETDQTPVVWTKMGNGFLGYVGDVNGESNEIILSMCGL